MGCGSLVTVPPLFTKPSSGIQGISECVTRTRRVRMVLQAERELYPPQPNATSYTYGEQALAYYSQSFPRTWSNPSFLVKIAKIQQLILKLLPPPPIGLSLRLLILSAIELSAWSCRGDLIRYISMSMECLCTVVLASTCVSLGPGATLTFFQRLRIESDSASLWSSSILTWYLWNFSTQSLQAPKAAPNV